MTFRTDELYPLATTDYLLVVSDFDGTLAGFSTDMYDVPINQGAVAALRSLTTLPRTEVAILSGRHIEGLRTVSGFDDEFILAGSHGAESTIGTAELTDAQREALELVTQQFEELAKDVDGAFVEYKPYHRVLHVIAAKDKEQAQAIYDKACEVSLPGVHLKPGKFIVEASVSTVTKGSWIAAARKELRPSGIVFIGDDATDEDGFAVLAGTDLSVKVGPGTTHARVRVDDIPAVAEFLAELVRLRRTHLGLGGATVEPE
ncbi:MAG: trehalose-phosphatase [Corynebacterium sp.]|uniref:trehalose-phosphatase n=1 Tax=Corynebacterium sp. TaxID=1720 RepID=UPI0026DCD620|nr:trehalose-phosphatase [Corynebacterium sp.]MDO5099430.1 trehalose-phosphatase [Corynebacterium sp.]